MPFLNLNYQLLMYEDPNPKDPKIRTPDISRDIQQVCVSKPKSDSFIIYPNEVQTILTTQRSLSFGPSTQIAIARPFATQDYVRLTYTGTGTNPVFRTSRAIGGDATSEVSITRLTPYVARIQNTAGTAWTLSSVLTNDIFKIEKTTDTFTSPFDPIYQGHSLVVQAKGSDYIDVIDNGLFPELPVAVVLGADFAFVLSVFSPGPVRIGDSIEVSGAGIHPANHGKYIISDIAPTYIEIVNPYAVTETFLYSTTNSIIAYDRLVGFVLIRGDTTFKVRVGNATEWTICDRLGPESLYMSSNRTSKIEASNDGPDAVTLSVIYASID
jgi:hypothetical protein